MSSFSSLDDKLYFLVSRWSNILKNGASTGAKKIEVSLFSAFQKLFTLCVLVESGPGSKKYVKSLSDIAPLLQLLQLMFKPCACSGIQHDWSSLQ